MEYSKCLLNGSIFISVGLFPAMIFTELDRPHFPFALTEGWDYIDIYKVTAGLPS